MTQPPVMRISCRLVKDVRVANSTRAGVLISSEDVRTLRLVAQRDIWVAFVCDGRPIYQGRARSLLQRVIHLADGQQWYLPTTKTGPLKPPHLPPLVD